MRKPLIYASGLAVLAILLAGLFGDRGLQTYLGLRSEQRELEAEVRELRLREERLQSELDALAEDPTALERVARERYRMLQVGERSIEVVDDRDTPSPATDLPPD